MMRCKRAAVFVCLFVLAAAQAQAAKPAVSPPQAQSDFWVSFGGGYYNGQDYDPPSGQPKTDAQDAEGVEGMVALNLAGPVLVRLRAAWMADYTRNTAEDVGVLFGVPLVEGRAFLAAGASRLTDVSNREQSPSIGVPVELLFYPTRGLEFAIHGNFNPDSDFVGITLAGVFGKQRAK